MPSVRRKVAANRKPSISLPTTPTKQAQGPQDYIMLFFGAPKVGKTTFVNALGRVLFLSTDRGTRFMDSMAVPIDTASDLNKVMKELEKPGACDAYDYICIDHIDDWAFMAEQETCRKLGIDSLGEAAYAKGWNEYKKQLRALVARMKALPVGIVFIAHETIKPVKTRAIEIDKTMPEMTKTAWKTIVPLVDVIGYLGFKRVKPKGGKAKDVHVLITQPTDSLYAGDRTDRRKPTNGYDERPEHDPAGPFLASFSPQTTTRRKVTRRKKKVTR